MKILVVLVLSVLSVAQTKQPKPPPKATAPSKSSASLKANPQAAKLSAEYPAECAPNYVFPHWYPESYYLPTSGGNYKYVQAQPWNLEVFGEHCHFDKKPPAVPKEFPQNSKVQVNGPDWATIQISTNPAPPAKK